MLNLPITPTWLRVLLIVVAIGWLEYQLVDYVQTVERQACSLKTTTTTLDQTKADLGASEGLRRDEGAAAMAQQGASDDQINRIRTLQTQLDGARSASERLRKQLDATADQAQQQCGAPGDPAAEQSRAAISALAAVFGACEAEQRELAAAAAEHYSTGLRCEADYDALTSSHDLTQ